MILLVQIRCCVENKYTSKDEREEQGWAVLQLRVLCSCSVMAACFETQAS